MEINEIIGNKDMLEIIRVSNIKGKDGIFLPVRVILWKRNSKFHKFITHLAVLQENGKYSLNYGHYFESFEKALTDYYKRCEYEGVNK